jgi:hypothetical protein
MWNLLQFLSEQSAFQGSTDPVHWRNFRCKWLYDYVRTILKSGEVTVPLANGECIGGGLMVGKVCNDKSIYLELHRNLAPKTVRGTYCKLTSANLKNFGENVMGWQPYTAVNGVSMSLWSSLVVFHWQTMYRNVQEVPIRSLGKLHTERVRSQKDFRTGFFWL